MKYLIVLTCALVAASATYVPSSFYGYHIPVIGPGGVPVETPEVQAAKANHFAAHAARSGVVHPSVVYTGHHGIPAIAPDGTPLDTPEVAAAKANHYAIHATHGSYIGTPYAVATVGPVDTPEVQHAKAAHFAAHAEANARNGLVAHFRKRRGIFGYQHIPVIGQNGVPLDTPEVQAAKAYHFAAHAEAATRNAIAAPVVAHAYTAYPYHIPVIGPGGVPVETPEVQAAKANHFAAHAAASTRSGYYSPLMYDAHHVGGWAFGIQANGAPLDTPEVQAAKIAHLAAHAAVRGHL